MKKSTISFDDINKSIKILGLIGLENRDMIKKRYLELSKKYHPDMTDGDTQKFQEINKAYKVVEQYVNSFKFSFSKSEFADQYPYAFIEEDKEWFKKR